MLSLQANQILGLRPGEVFVQRNVGNLATHKDMNCMTCLEYAVNALKVKHVIICGHYNCGAVKASITLTGKTQGLANLWVSDIKDTRNKHAAELGKLSPDEQVTRYLSSNGHSHAMVPAHGDHSHILAPCTQLLSADYLPDPGS